MADTLTDEGTVYSQRNQFVGYNYQAVLRMHQAMPKMHQAVPLMTNSRGIPQQRETANFEMEPGQSYLEYVNE